MNALMEVERETPAETRLRLTVNELCESAGNVIIMTRPDLSHATDLVKAIKSRSKEIEDERKRLVDPFNAGVKAINARFKAMSAPLDEAESDVKAKMLSFQQAEELRARQEQERLAKIQREADERARQEAEERARQEAEERRKQEAEQAADRTLDRAPLPAPPPSVEPIAPPVVVVSTHRPTTYGQTGAVSTVKKVWVYEVVDIAALAAARPDLVQVDAVKVNQEIRGRGGNIEGLRIYEKDVLQVR